MVTRIWVHHEGRGHGEGAGMVKITLRLKQHRVIYSGALEADGFDFTRTVYVLREEGIYRMRRRTRVEAGRLDVDSVEMSIARTFKGGTPTWELST